MASSSRIRATAVAALLAGAATVALLSGCTAAATGAAPTAAANASAPASLAPKPPAPAPKPTATTPPAPPTAAACQTTPAGVKHIYVSISQQHMWACTGSTLTTESAVTTGASALTNVSDATPVGTFAIASKSVHVTLAGSDVKGSWNDPVTYWMPFTGGDGFHDSPWQKFPLGSPLYTTQGSHGCVHVALPALTTLYNWAPVGTPVTVSA